MKTQKQFNPSQKLTKIQVEQAMKEGAILSQTRSPYPYWLLTFSDDTYHENIRKDATKGLENIELFHSDKFADSYRLKK
jgi:hypothetical protein